MRGACYILSFRFFCSHRYSRHPEHHRISSPTHASLTPLTSPPFLTRHSRGLVCAFAVSCTASSTSTSTYLQRTQERRRVGDCTWPPLPSSPPAHQPPLGAHAALTTSAPTTSTLGQSRSISANHLASSAPISSRHSACAVPSAAAVSASKSRLLASSTPLASAKSTPILRRGRIRVPIRTKEDNCACPSANWSASSI